MTDRRLIEAAFPLKQASLDSVHEKNVRHGHISTLHIWPARRPLAAARAALIAALLPDPGTPEGRKKVLERIGGRVVERIERRRVGGRTVETTKEETVGGILHWGRENGPELERFRREIREAHGGRAPRVLDPFAGGGAIPLEAMRLGCEATAIDINPVAWFLLKCTLDYPQRLAGKTRPLPDFARRDGAFMEAFLKAKGFKGAGLRTMLERLGHGGADVQLDALPGADPALEADLAWHVRAWGRRALAEARKTLAPRYPIYAEYAPLEPGGDCEPRPLRLLETGADGAAPVAPLNAGFDDAYLRDRRNPRWVAKPTVAFLWARTVVCKNCRGVLPLLKTRWLCRKDGKRALLTMEAGGEGGGVSFGVRPDVPRNGGNAAQRREHDRRLGAGTMSRAGATCPGCGAVMAMADIRHEGRAGRLGAVLTAVVVDGPKGKEYRLPETEELRAAEVSREVLDTLYAEIPFGLPEERTPLQGGGAARAFSVENYGFDRWSSLFTVRQLLALGTFVRTLRRCAGEMDDYPDEWREAVLACLAPSISRLADRGSALATWTNDPEKIRSTFARFALPIVWDFAESCPLADTTGGFVQAIEWIARVVEHLQDAAAQSPGAQVLRRSATETLSGSFDAIVTDPPYYDAIPYSDLMDFFHVWMRRALCGLSDEIDAAFAEPLGPKWDREAGDGELIDDASRFDGDRARSKTTYEDGMARAFQACHGALKPDGRLVVVFANKSPDAWETLAAALIRAGFVVDGSWPIQTEMQNRQRSLASAALASSVWLVCRKRPARARPGWDNKVLAGMRENIALQLREFWDAGIRGPDFVWAATGPALEAFSEHPVVKVANAPDQLMTVSEFLREVRRTVVDFVVGRVLAPDGDAAAAAGLDDATAYYLLHRHDFGMADAPVGACILYALSCNLSDNALVKRFDLLARPGAARAGAETSGGEADEGANEDGGGGGARLRLKVWSRRLGRGLGVDGPDGRPAPLVDRTHKLMQLWRAGDRAKVDDYLDSGGLKRNALFARVLQALIELADAGSDERAILESVSNHLAARERTAAPRQTALRFGEGRSG